MIDGVVSKARDADVAASFFCRALESTGVSPRLATTDKAVAYPPALAEALPTVEHARGKILQQGLVLRKVQ